MDMGPRQCRVSFLVFFPTYLYFYFIFVVISETLLLGVESGTVSVKYTIHLYVLTMYLILFFL